MKRKIRHLAVVSINRDKYSETFIRDAFDFFPCRKSLLYGDYLPTHVTTDWRIVGHAIDAAPIPFWEAKPKTEEEQAGRNLRNWLRKDRPALVIANYGPSGVAIVEICSELGLPLVVHFHGYDAFRSDILETYGQSYPALFASAKALVVVSRHMEDQLLRLGAPKEKIHHYIYGVNTNFFGVAPFPELPFKFLFVGRFVPKKAPDLLLKAFCKILLQVPAVKLEMIGDGEMLESCKQLACDLGITNAVRFVGAVSPAEVAHAISASHTLILPSCTTKDGDSEGTPLVILEAGASSRPTISTKHGGIVDVIIDGVNGLLVTENDEAALVNAMLRLVRQPNLAQEMGQAARKIVVERFEQQGYHQNLWRLLEDVNQIR